MKNFLSKHYKHYYILTAAGQSIETTRQECLRISENSSDVNSYKQRWFYDGEQFSYIIRLPRTEQGEALYRMNASDIKKEKRYQAQKYACVLKGSSECGNDCESCQRKRYPRTIELDKPLNSNSDNDSEPRYYEVAAVDEFSEYENRTILDGALAKLLPEQADLIRKIFYEGHTVQEIATMQGVDKSAISHRLQRAYKKLKNFLN